MKQTRLFDEKQAEKGNALVVFLLIRGINSAMYIDYIDDGFGDEEPVFFVKYEDGAQMYVDAWEAFMDVKYIQ